jgi:hypothetical protein
MLIERVLPMIGRCEKVVFRKGSSIRTNIRTFARVKIDRTTNNSVTVSNSLVLKDQNTKVANPWVETKDPKGSGLIYYWNPNTNETTALGAPKPRNWVEVEDPNGSALTYWWDPETNQTTALGAPRPSDFQQLANYQPPPQTIYVAEPSLKTYFFLGAGLTLGISLVGALFR